jgi:hypothetical protein
MTVLLGRFKILDALRIGVDVQIGERQLNDILGRVQEGDAAVREMSDTSGSNIMARLSRGAPGMRALIWSTL